MKPLEGITVLSVEQAVAVPFATRQLADLGARVIKVERPPTGDFARDYDSTVHGMSSHFVWLNRSKESMTLDLKSENAKPVFERLLAEADVFIQNLAPGAMERLGYGTEALRERYPELITCNLTGYGDTGPYKNKKAYDLLVQCEAGLVSVTGSEDVPSKAGISIADIAAGMYMYSGILTALLVRSRTGEGQTVNVSMLEALGEWMGYPTYYAAYGGEEPQRKGASHSTIFPYGPFQCGDGKTVFVGLQNEREWLSFCENVLQKSETTDDERFATNAKRSENRQALTELIERVFSKLNRDNVIERLEAAKIANARLNSMKEFFEHPQLKARERWKEVHTPNGPIQALLPPASISGVEPKMGDVPELGEHTTSILEEFGFETIKK
ncbi:CaiB/BaiF CoA transferase family protein [Salicibibacter kimchii]|uniref:CoA transferase n=1 Tax=Salicibibacter kimchii TaxID=2099786 RepID=A0A345BW87_9BACI|nr:CaiB/BaiF CoA-transferase family protein [Salicibibacter kimchii]AXF55218.1 CoA transferase [Salicibibacter kimchii]